MKVNKIVILLFVSLAIISCTKKEAITDSGLTGSWKLTEILADPGDGSGTFQPVTSDKVITFQTDGTVTSNGLICSMSPESNSDDSGTYSLADSTINASGCGDTPFDITFQFERGELIINYPCIEPCRAKFIKK